MNKKILIILLFFLFNFTNAQKIISVNIDSGSILPESGVTEVSSKFINQNFVPSQIDSILSSIYSFYTDEGYHFPSLLENEIMFNKDSSTVSINLKFNPGKPVIIDSIAIPENNSQFDEIIETSRGRILSKKNLQSLSLKLLNELEKKGYAFAKIEVKSILIEKFSASLFLQINKGDKSVIDEIVVKGNETTEDYVILRELPFRIGDFFSEESLIEARNNLLRMNYFKTVSELQYKILSDGKGLIEIFVEEKNTNNFDGIVGYVPKTNTEDGYFTGFVNISMRNLFGTGRMAAIKWQQYNRNSQEFELKYKEPWIFNFPVSVNLEFYQKKQDTTFVRRYLAAKLSYLISNKINAGFIFETEAVIPTLKEPPQFTVYNSSIITTGINLTIDTRDDFLSPGSGFYLSNNYKFSKKTINGPQEFIADVEEKSIEIQRFEIDFEYYKTFAMKHTIALKLGGREIKSDLTETSDNYYIGGNNTLRGYREQQFSGNRVLWSNLEYRYRLESRSYLFLFFDTGYFELGENDSVETPKISDFLTGYGGGISLETSLGLMSISYALGKEDSFTQGKIHIGLVNEF